LSWLRRRTTRPRSLSRERQPDTAIPWVDADGCRHYQLRHFISCPEPDLVYYASGAAVYCLNAATRTQAHVTTLPWEARCTASGYGYVCVGGEEHGNFAAIKVTGFPPTDPSDVDASLPLDFQHRLPRPPILGAASRVRLEKIGTDIVNSISIHKLPAEGNGQDDVVAVLTNNDKTVRIYSLTQNLELAVIDLEFAMNHASISPDGQMLVAVGDAPIGFFFERTDSRKPSNKIREGLMQSTPPVWTELHRVNLYRPAHSHADGYFTTAWSPSGRLCAVGSECGYITVFDIELLKLVEYGEDAILQLISSTRPDSRTGPGAVRTMHFSPAPWDFLIWSEDQGRVCIADLRAGLKLKQTLTLDPKEEGLETVEIADFDLNLSPEMHELRREADLIRRYRRALDGEGNTTTANVANEYLETDTERQRLHRRLGVVESDNDPLGLTVRERQVLSALRTRHRQPEEARDEQEVTPRSINYTTSERLNTVPYVTHKLLRQCETDEMQGAYSSRGSRCDGSLHGRKDWADSLTQLAPRAHNTSPSGFRHRVHKRGHSQRTSCPHQYHRLCPYPLTKRGAGTRASRDQRASCFDR